MEKKIVNSTRTLSRVQGDSAFVAELYSAFLQDLNVKVDNIQQASLQINYEELGKAAHRLKGACGAIDAERLQAWAMEVESAVKSGKTDGMQSHMLVFDAEWRAVKRALESWLTEEKDEQ